MPWQYIGEANFGPDDDEVTVGPLEVPTQGGLLVKLWQVDPTPFQFGFCLLSYRSALGRELGTIRVHPREEFTVYHLGEHMRVLDPTGVLVIEPRTWNLRWVRAGFPLRLGVLADLPAPTGSETFTPPGFATPAGAPLPINPTGSPLFPT